MRVIKAANADWHPQYTCPGCDTVLELEVPDLKLKHYDSDPREIGYDKFYVNCSVCKYEIQIKADTIPKLVKILLSTK